MHPVRALALAGITLLATGVAVVSSQGLAQIAVGSLPYEPDLRSGFAFTGQICRATHGDGGLIVTRISVDGSCMFLLNHDLRLTTSYRIDVTQRLRQGPQGEPFGIFFGERRDANRQPYLTLMMTGTEAALEYWDGKWNRIAPVNPAPRPRVGPGVTNRLSVEVRGNELRAFINGELLASGVSPLPADGRTGVVVNGTGQEAVFTEFRVTSLAPTTIAKLPPATPPAAPGGSPTRMTPGGTVFLDDDLTAQKTFALIQDEFCATAYADGGLRINGIGVNGCEWYPGNLTEAPMRARFELSTRVLKGDTLGMVAGYSSRADKLHYHLLVSATGQFALEITQNGSSRALIPWTPSTVVRTGLGATNRLALEVDVQELRAFVNGQFVGRAASPEPVHGSYGFILIGKDSSAVFSNLRITDLSAQPTVAREGGTSRSLVTGGKISGRGAPEPRVAESRGQRKSS